MSDGGCVGVMVVVCESWWLCVGHGGWLCVSDSGCVWVMVVVCVSREMYLRMPSYVKVPTTSAIQG